MRRGEIWLVNLDPIKGREQVGTRPALVISVEPFNNSGLELIVVCPVTSKNKGFPTHVPLIPEESGLNAQSYVKTEDIRSVSVQRLIKAVGQVSPSKLEEVEICLRRILGLS